MTNTENKIYETPDITILSVNTEGILCSSEASNNYLYLPDVNWKGGDEGDDW